MVEYILKVKVNGNVIYVKEGYDKEIAELTTSIKPIESAYNIEDILTKEGKKCKVV